MTYNMQIDYVHIFYNIQLVTTYSQPDENDCHICFNSPFSNCV